MPTTRSQRQAGAAAPESAAEPGAKHKLEEGVSPGSDSQRGKAIKVEEKGQSTIEESLGRPRESGDNNDADDEGKNSSDVNKDTTKTTAEKAHARDAPPTNVLEKGLFYLFVRGRVDTDGQPTSVSDIARTHFILRPIAKDAALSAHPGQQDGHNPIGDAGNARLLALPKKALPRSGRERFLCFVEKCGASFAQLREEFLHGNDYETKTSGARHTPAATPVAEGVYAITSTGRTSHFAYVMTLPGEVGEVQRKLGIGADGKGSFVLSTRNPDTSAPAGAAVPQGPEYPEEIKRSFRSLRWLPTQPEHFNYINSQVLLVGESHGPDSALEPENDRDEDNKATAEEEDPAEELEKLEKEDYERVKGPDGDVCGTEAIWADLQVRAGDYPKLQTTF